MAEFSRSVTTCFGRWPVRERRAIRSIGRLASLSTAGLAVIALSGLGACEPPGTRVVIAATTSTHDTGLLETLVAEFEDEMLAAGHRYELKVVVAGTGEALALGRRGDVDALLVHSPQAEERFVRGGFSERRTPVMFNDFVLVGPADDPAGVRDTRTSVSAFAAIRNSRSSFISRGDSSGTHIRELAAWVAAAVDPEELHQVPPRRRGKGLRGASAAAAQAEAGQGRWYRETGQGQGESLLIASERQAYALTDRATYLTMRPVLDLEILHEGDPELLNVYSVLVAAKAAHPDGARAFADWLTSDAGRRAIERFGRGEIDTPLFVPVPAGGLDLDRVPAEHPPADSLSGAPESSP